MGRESWDTFLRIVEKHAPYDSLLCPSDFVEGRGDKSGGTELLTTSVFGQVEIFVDVLKQIRPFFRSKGPIPLELVFGTSYHTAFGGEDWEDVLACHKDLRMYSIPKPGAHTWVKSGGVTFDLKHHVGRSATPYGQWTPLARAMVWNSLWNMKKGQPLADVLIRGHVHYHIAAIQGKRLAVTAPCLSWGSKFGSRRCDEEIDWGILWFDCENGAYEWGSELVVLEAMKPKVRILR